MRILAIETATEACSVALFDGPVLVEARHEVLGRGHAERLVPMIAELPDKGRATEIRVSLGPGSFTGVRIGLAVARALGIAWNANVLGYPTLALVAAQAGEASTVCMNGGHGEWFIQRFSADGLPEAEVRSLTRAAAAGEMHARLIAGNRAEELAAMLGGEHIVRDMLPSAANAQRLPPALLTVDLAPLYGRAPDAKLPEI
ncbi:tRNA (adenosine(37)-N6)-threonylcarbamoyltransferase complex dimerization subunit type 1 TsaB [Erythrobacter mangrovi]|uniref:tRNA (Adenosine(37)-N6)-threonylcarbamoyltransferase complex dimerization subunit type 1 TsaB n=1 Tax=Erythrobacter mangrovi TaxID=2739433 RepID=A0A7D3XGG5_9SPHN|nr:tRNA (adenosine(37)-N6)-threonylcarbamoyltransferase complex dimerization subunit type 1 TsaB [Erythrobacter mangrovi]QKG70258.1 tRNA (adenosine(37)-N6)-threonylcarbamoyltransferase complex dimerization subunit type 1 TsaB [Erythrobacter mangrovi]